MENIGEQQRELHRAIAAGEIDRAVAMIRPMPALLDTPYSKDVDSKEGTPLHQVLASSNVNMMKALLELNPKQPNVLNNEGRTALSYYDVARINGRSDFMPYFVAVSKGCEVDPNSVKQTNDRALLILKKIRGHFDDRFLEIAKMELDDFCDIETLPNRNKNPKAFCGYLLTLYAADAIAWEVGEGIHSPEPEFGAGMLELIQKQGTHW